MIVNEYSLAASIECLFDRNDYNSSLMEFNCEQLANYQFLSDEEKVLRNLHHLLTLRDTSAAFLLIASSKTAIIFKPFANLIHLCIAKIELIKTLVYQSNFEEDIQEEMNKAFHIVDYDFEAIHKLALIFDHSVSGIYQDSIEWIIEKLVKSIIQYVCCKEIFLIEFSDERESLKSFDSKMLEHIQRVMPKSAVLGIGKICVNRIKSQKNELRSSSTIFTIKKIGKSELLTFRKESSSSEAESYFAHYFSSSMYNTKETQSEMEVEPNTFKKKKNVKLSLIKSFKFKQLKRENIDKKVIKRFLKELDCNKPNSEQAAEAFDQIISIGAPPTQHKDVFYKSFNTSYMILLFTVNGAKELYEAFIKKSIYEMIKLISSTYSITDYDEIEMLRRYLRSIGIIFGQYIMKG